MCIAVFKQRTILVERINKVTGEKTSVVLDAATVTLKNLLDYYNDERFLTTISFN